MHRSLGMFLALATLSAAAHAQYTDPASQQPSPNLQPAPVVQGYPGHSRAAAASQLFDTQPNAGISVRSDTPNGVQTVTSSNTLTELRIAQGRADITVHHPADHSEILIDLPGGQVSLLKDGLYTFNAQTDTVRVLHGEAEAYTGPRDSSAKGAKVKETQQLSFFENARPKAVNAYPYELTADLLGGEGSHGDGPVYGGYDGGFYGPYPYYAGVYPYGFYPYGYGYPFGVGLGFGYYGGFYRGGFGGYRGGFHGGGFRR